MDEKTTNAPIEQKTEGTPEVILNELKAELERLKEENSKLKNAQSNASADASKYKKQLQERMTEQERAANETKELIERLKQENAQMKRNQTLAEQTSGFMGVGFDSDLAKKAAEAHVDGDFSSMLNALRDFITQHDKNIRADELRNTPRPGVGGATAPTVTKEQFATMNYSERLKIHDEYPDLYKELVK